MRQNIRKVLGLAFLCCLMPVALFAQNINVTGKITDANGDSVIGAAVAVQNTTTGTVTDIDGNYSISVPRNAVLEVSSQGMKCRVMRSPQPPGVLFVLRRPS